MAESIESQAGKLAEAASNKDGFTAARIFQEVGLCHVSDLMKAYNSQLLGPSLVLTDNGAAPNGGEYLSLGITDSDWFRATAIIPLAPQFVVRDCNR